jgi:4-alpha-glucanotransferase
MGRLHLCKEKGIQIMEISYAHDKNVWAHPELFSWINLVSLLSLLSPPDYFSATKLWGKIVERQSHQARLRLDRIDKPNLVDFIRWIISADLQVMGVPGKAKTAVKGKWKKGPGKHFFSIVKKALGDLPIIAEDLGVITPDVVAIVKDSTFQA